MAVAEVIRRSGDRQLWRVEEEEIQWSRGKEKGFIDIAISRDQAIGVIECKKVNNDDRLVFLTRHNRNPSVTRCRLEIYMDEFLERDGESAAARSLRMMEGPRFLVGDCNMPTGSPESSFCVAPRGKNTANLSLDDIASHLLESCEGLLGDWHIRLPGDVAACIPIIVTNATLWTCAFDPGTMDLGSGDLPPDASFEQRSFIRFRKAFRHSPGLSDTDEKDNLAQVVEQGERTVFVVDARQLVPFLTGLRCLMYELPGAKRSRQLVGG